MTRIVVVGFALTCAAFTAGSAMLAGQSREQQTLEPGKMSLAKVLIVNEGHKEAVPVAMEPMADPIKVQAARQAWEYRQVSLAANQDPTQALNIAGLEGWEATGIALPASGSTVLILKRPR